MDVEEIWDATDRNDEEQKLTIYKILSEVSSTLRSEHIEILIQHVNQINIANIIKEEVELAYDLCRYERIGEYSTKSRDLFWSIIQNEHKFT